MPQYDQIFISIITIERNQSFIDFEVLRLLDWVINEEVSLIQVTGNADCLTQIRYIVTESDPILTSEEAWKILLTLRRSVTCTLSSNKFHSLSLDVKSLDIQLGNTEITDQIVEVYLFGVVGVSLTSCTYWNINLDFLVFLLFWITTPFLVWWLSSLVEWLPRTQSNVAPRH